MAGGSDWLIFIALGAICFGVIVLINRSASSGEQVACPACGHMNAPNRRWCQSCKVDRMSYSEQKKRVDLADSAERARILDVAKRDYIAKGYRVVSETDFSAQMVKPKSFSLLLALLGFLFFLLGFFVYLLYYFSQGDQTAYLSVDEFGNLSRA